MHVIETFRRMIADILHQRAFRPLHIGKPSAARRLHVLGLRLRDLRPRQAQERRP